MRRSWWRTGPPMKHTQPIPRSSGGQLLRQMAVLALILLLWGGGFLLFLNATGAAGVIAVVEITATYTATPAPTPTPTRAASNTPAPTSTRPPTKPAAMATSVPTSTAAPTDTSVPIETPTSVATAADVAPAAISFQRDVQPIFNQICVKCHGGEEVKEGLSLKTYAEVMRGSDNGPVIVAGDPANSFLIEQVVNGKMPKQGPKLLPAQIRAITDWVAAGAPNN